MFRPAGRHQVLMMIIRPKNVVQDKVQYNAWILTSFKSVVLFYDKDLKTNT
jgi:hypothetical protein